MVAGGSPEQTERLARIKRLGEKDSQCAPDYIAVAERSHRSQQAAPFGYILCPLGGLVQTIEPRAVTVARGDAEDDIDHVGVDALTIFEPAIHKALGFHN